MEERSCENKISISLFSNKYNFQKLIFQYPFSKDPKITCCSSLAKFVRCFIKGKHILTESLWFGGRDG